VATPRLLLAVRAHLPGGLDRPAAVATDLAQAAHAVGADQELVFDLGLAEWAASVLSQTLLQRAHLELALVHVLEVLGRTHDGVDEETEGTENEPGQHGHGDDHLVVDPAARVLEDPVGATEPQHDDQEPEHHLDEMPSRRLEEVLD